MLLASTNSYFGHQTDTGTDSWATGAVVITDDSPGAALFSATNIAPGYIETKTVTVTNASSIEDPDEVEVLRMVGRGLDPVAGVKGALRRPAAALDTGSVSATATCRV